MEEEINQNRPEEVRPPPKGEPAAEHSFDELAKGLANRSLSRGDALRWAGRALAGGLLAAIPGIAWAQNIPQDPSGKGGPGLEQDSPQAPSGKGGPGLEQDSPQAPLGKGGPGLEQDSPQDPTGKGGAEPEQASPQTPTTQASQQSDKLRGCSTGLTRCPPAGCVDLSSDNNNCGSCGRICSGGTTCQGGSCACPSGQTDCGGHVSTLRPTQLTVVVAASRASQGRLAKTGCAPECIVSTLHAPQPTVTLGSGAAVPGFLNTAITRRLISAAQAFTVVTTTAPPARSAILVLRVAATASALTLGPPAHSQLSELPGKEVVATIRLRGPGMDRHGPLNLT